MEDKRYKVTFDGTTEEGLSKEEVKKNLSSVHKMIEDIIDADSPIVLKKSVDHQTAIKIKETFKQAGAICKIYELTKQGKDILVDSDEHKDESKDVSHRTGDGFEPNNNDKARIEEEEKANADWEERTLCNDKNCIGIIGPDGYCKECGNPFENKPKNEYQESTDESDEEIPRGMLNCKTCGKTISVNAKICPECGEPSSDEKKKDETDNLMKAGFSILISIIFIVILIFIVRTCIF